MPSVDVEDGRTQRTRQRVTHAAVFGFFVLLTVAQTWPLAARPDYWSRHDNGDAILNEWVLAWIAHILPQHPLQLFNANIFYPEPRTLAFSEHMIVQGLFGLPLFAFGASSLVVYNVVLLLGLLLTAFTMYLLIERWTGNRDAGILAGCLAAFNAHTFTRLPHLQALHVEFIPLVLLLLDRLLTRPRVRTGVLLGIVFALQGLTSYYWLVFTTFGVAAATIVRRDAWWGSRSRELALPAAAAAVTAAVILFPFLWPYYKVSTTLGIVRSLGEVSLFSATWRDYLSTPGRLHFLSWSYLAWGEGGKTPLFPGVVATLLGVVGLLGIRRDRRIRMLLAVLIASLLLSLGTNLPGYETLYAVVPLLRGLRAPVRAGHLVLIALAALAGFGLAHLQRGRSTLVRTALIGVAVVLASAEVWLAPIWYTPRRELSKAAAVLQNERRAVVACLPMAPPNAPFLNAQCVLDSTQHWKPILNGYSGFLPGSYVRHWEELYDFPSPASLAYLVRAGVTHVIVYPEVPLPSVRALEPIASEAGVTVFRVRWERIDPGATR